jgi:hypothetical protein
MNGGERESLHDPRHLVDIFDFPFSPVGEDSDKLRHLRVDQKLSMRALSKSTGHSISYLQSQLRKFGIEKEKGNLGIAPYGWDWTGKKLVRNAKEQKVICEMKRLHQGGRSFSGIAKDLNQKRILSKGGGQWWAGTVSKTLQRELNK